MDNELLLTALRNSHSRVREWGIRLLTHAPWQNVALRAAVADLANDSDLRIRFQTAMAIAEMPGNERTKLLVTMATQSPFDPWLDDAILCSTGNQTASFMKALAVRMKSDPIESSPRLRSLIERAARMIGAFGICQMS